MNALELVLFLAKPFLLVWHFNKYFCESMDDLEESKQNDEPRADWLSIFLMLIAGILLGVVFSIFQGML